MVGLALGLHLAFTWEKPDRLGGLARLAESPWLTTFIFPQNPIFAYKFSFYNVHINKLAELVKRKAGQDKLCRVQGALTC